MSLRHNRLKNLWETGGLKQLVVMTTGLVIAWLIFMNMDPMFASSRNQMSLLRDIAPILLIGVGQSVVLVTGNIDLSIGSVVGMGCMISATLMTRGVPAFFAAAIALGGCFIFGVVNGELVGRIKIPPYIATLGTMILGRGFAQISNGSHDTGYIGINATAFRDFFYYGRTLGLYNTVWIGLAIWIVILFLLTKTRTGRYIYAVGSNRDAARLSGVNVIGTIDKAFIISALCAGIAGLIMTAEQAFGSTDAGTSFELYAVAAAVIGGISTLGGKGLLFGTAIGAAIWGVLQNGLVRIYAPVAIRNILIGILVIVIVALDVSARYKRSGVKEIS